MYVNTVSTIISFSAALCYSNNQLMFFVWLFPEEMAAGINDRAIANTLEAMDNVGLRLLRRFKVEFLELK